MPFVQAALAAPAHGTQAVRARSSARLVAGVAARRSDCSSEEPLGEENPLDRRPRLAHELADRAGRFK